MLGHRDAPDLRRIHPVDHPVALIAGAEERVAPAQALAVEDRDHLVVFELLGVVEPAVPDQYPARAVASLWDLAFEVEVLERVILDVDRLAVVRGILGDAVRHRPREQHAVVLETQVPVQAPRVMLLHDEARLRGLLGAACSARPWRRLRRLPEVAFGAILA